MLIHRVGQLVMGAATMMRQAHHGIGGAVEFSSFRRKDFRLST